jgi:hypothetical protein
MPQRAVTGTSNGRTGVVTSVGAAASDLPYQKIVEIRTGDERRASRAMTYVSNTGGGGNAACRALSTTIF